MHQAELFSDLCAKTLEVNLDIQVEVDDEALVSPQSNFLSSNVQRGTNCYVEIVQIDVSN